jgi:hypothetical protein
MLWAALQVWSRRCTRRRPSSRRQGQRQGRPQWQLPTLPDLKVQLASTQAALAQSTADAKAWEERAVGVEAIAARVPGLEATVREKEVLVESLRAELEEALRVELEEAGGKVPLSLQVCVFPAPFSLVSHF